jgi:hypothetical protein
VPLAVARPIFGSRPPGCACPCGERPCLAVPLVCSACSWWLCLRDFWFACAGARGGAGGRYLDNHSLVRLFVTAARMSQEPKQTPSGLVKAASAERVSQPLQIIGNPTDFNSTTADHEQLTKGFAGAFQQYRDTVVSKLDRC